MRVLGTALLALTLLGACGQKEFRNQARPAQPAEVSVVISQRSVNVEPAQVGGGPLAITLANVSNRTVRITVETDEVGSDKPGLRQSTGPINPQGTGQLDFNAEQGTYTVSTDASRIAPATLEVGPDRGSAQDQLLEP